MKVASMHGSVLVDYRLLALRSGDYLGGDDGVFIGNLRGYAGGFDLLTARWGGPIKFDVTVWDGEPESLSGESVEFSISNDQPAFFTSATTNQYVSAENLKLLTGRTYKVQAFGVGTTRSEIFLHDENESWHIDIWQAERL